MVLYVEALKVNALNYIKVATMLKSVLDRVGVECGNYEESMESCRVNVVALEGLLAAGITELEVPEKKG